MSGFGSTSLGRILAQGGGASHTGDTNLATLATVTLPGGSMEANGQLQINTVWTFGGAAGTKTFKVNLGASAILNATATATMVNGRYPIVVQNQGATGSQVSHTGGAFGATTTAGWVVSSSVDTTVDQTITLTGQLGSAADTITLASYQIILYPKG